MSSIKYKVEKFDGRNSFSLWRIKMRALLTQQDLLEALAGRDKMPSTMSEEEKNTKVAKALATIQLCLADEVLMEVADETSAASLWLKLESLYMTKSVTSKLYLKQRLFTFRMKEGMSLKSHLDNLNSILMDLKNIDAKVEDEDAALILLCSLPPSYEHFVNSMIYGRENLSLEEVRSSLHSYELRQKVTGNGEEVQAQGLFAKSSYQGDRQGRLEKGAGSSNFRERSKSRSRFNNIECYYCKKKGHIKSECLKLKAKEEKQKQESSSVAGVADKESYDDPSAVLSITDRARPVDGWVMDSGCSFHMCPHQDWFSTYEKIDGGVVLMGDNTPRKIVGIGTIQIKMHDGVVRTLGEVRHVPELKKNLISLGILDRKGYRCAIEGGVLRVVKGALVIMKGMLTSSLYILQGNTVAGGAAVSSGEPDSDTTKLLHMRLGHMSERGMTVLSKRDLLGGHKVEQLDFCEHRVFGKQKRIQFGVATDITKSTLDYIRSDVWGPSQVYSKGGARYMLSISSGGG